MSDRVLIAPSILSADFGALRHSVQLLEDAADVIHVDVMDGHFVPNLTIGPPVVRALKRCCDMPLDVHLMIDNADETVDWYLDAGSDWVTVHVEACRDVAGVLSRIRSAGAKAGISLNPATPVDTLAPVIADVDLVLVMSVNPGFGGQSFIESSPCKIESLVDLCADAGISPLICVDGGIDPTTAPLAVAAGARLLVAGNAVFGSPDPANAVRRIRSAAAEALL